MAFLNDSVSESSHDSIKYSTVSDFEYLTIRPTKYKKYIGSRHFAVFIPKQTCKKSASLVVPKSLWVGVYRGTYLWDLKIYCNAYCTGACS